METGETGESGKVEGVEEGKKESEGSQSQSQSTPLLARKLSSEGSEGSVGKRAVKTSEKKATTKKKTGSIMNFFSKKWAVCVEET